MNTISAISTLVTDLRMEDMRDFHPSEGNTFSDHALRCAVDGKVLLTKEQTQAVEDHLDCLGTSVDALLWAYCGYYYEIDGGYIDEDSQAYWLVSSPFDPYLPVPDSIEPTPHDGGEIPFYDDMVSDQHHVDPVAVYLSSEMEWPYTAETAPKVTVEF